MLLQLKMNDCVFNPSINNNHAYFLIITGWNMTYFAKIKNSLANNEGLPNAIYTAHQFFILADKAVGHDVQNHG